MRTVPVKQGGAYVFWLLRTDDFKVVFVSETEPSAIFITPDKAKYCDTMVT